MLFGKRIYFLGSSITYGFASNGISMVEMIEEKTGAICFKNAVTGTPIADFVSDSYYSRLLNTKVSWKPDIFVCQLSTNDTNLVDFGPLDSQNVKETVGAIKAIIDYVSNEWGAKIVFYTSPKYANKKYEQLVKLLYEIQKERSFAILDFYNDIEFNARRKAIYMADDIHPTLTGYLEWWTPKFIAFLEKISS